MHRTTGFWKPIVFVSAFALACFSGGAASAQEPECGAKIVQQIQDYNKEALAKLLKNETIKAWHVVKKAIWAAGQSKCKRHQAVAMSYLLLGVVQFRGGRKQAKLQAWRQAIQISPNIALPKGLTNPRLARDFQSVRAYLLKLPGVKIVILCTPAVLRSIETLNNEAFTNMMVNDMAAARQKIDLAMATAQQKHCMRKPVMAKTYLLLGFLHHQAGRRREKMRAWRRALMLNRNVRLPWKSMPSRLTYHFKAVRADILEGWSGRRRTVSPTAAAGGCRRDTDCKGSRICHGGTCVYPTGGRGGETPSDRPRAAGVLPKGGKRFSDKGTVELGTGVGFLFSSTTMKGEGQKAKGQHITFDLNLYFGYFVTNRFVLGVYIGFPISRTKTTVSGVSVTQKDINFEFIFAPGIAFPFGRRAVFYLDGLIGVSTGTTETEDTDTGITMGLVGAELGLKFVLVSHLLLRVGFRPSYSFGKSKVQDNFGESKFDFSGVNIFLNLGLSAFF